MSKKKSPFNLNPDLVKSRCLSARLLSRKSQARAARDMGYSNTSMLSKMERKSSETGISYQFLARASLCYGVSVDYLLGLSDYPERDPRSVEQLAIYNSVQHFADNMLNELVETIIKGASTHVLETHLVMANDDMKILIDAVNKVRTLNPKFDDDIKGGANLLKALEQAQHRSKQIDHRLCKKEFEDNILRQFRAVIADGRDKQLDLVGYNNGNEEN